MKGTMVALGISLPLVIAVASAQENVTTLDEVVITATRLEKGIQDQATNVSLVSGEQIENSGAKNVAEAIEGLVGITEASERGGKGPSREIRMRSGGDTANQVLVLVDGQPINDVSLGAADLGDIPTDGIERVEVIRGPSSALWGANALGGVVNIVTRQPSEEGQVTKFGFRGGSFGTQNYNLAVSNKDEGRMFVFAASKDVSMGWRENSEYTGDDLFFKSAYDLDDMGKVGVRLTYHHSEFGLPGKNTTPFEAYDGEKERQAQFPDAAMSKERRHAQVAYERGIRGGGTVKLRTYGSLSDKRYECPTDFIDDLSSGASGGIEVQLIGPCGGVIGTDIRRDAFQRKNLAMSPAVVDIDEDIDYGSVFLQKDIVLRKLTLVLGGRYDHHSIFGGQGNPRAVLVYKPRDSLKLSANVGRAFRAPTFEDLYSPYTSWSASAWGPAGDTQGNEALKPERSWGYDVGFEHRCSGTVTTRATFFHTEIKDLIAWDEVDPDPDYDKWRPMNIGQAYNQGVEVEFIHRARTWLSQSISYCYLESKGKKEGEEDYIKLMYTPHNRANYDLTLKRRHGLRVNLRVNFTDVVKWVDDFDESHKLPDYTLVDCRVSQRVKRAEVFCAAENITDRKYQSREDYPLPGRSFYGGFNLTF